MPSIFLIGPMGSGKTTIGRRLAELLGLEFRDCDKELESATGASVNLIFDIEGEKGFRKRESKMLAELASIPNCVIATGGGSVLCPENRQVMHRSGLVVYLKTSVGQQLERLQHDSSRPLLQAEDRAGRLADLADARNPIYEEMADLVFPSPNRSVAAAAQRLSKVILSYWASESPGRESTD